MSEGPDISGTELITGSNLTALVRTPQPGKGTHPALIMIHGYGANESDIYELVPFVDRRVLIVAPRGPFLASEDTRGAFYWYDRVYFSGGDTSTFESSLKKLSQFIDELGQFSGVEVDPKQVYVGGFSQGAVMSLGLAANVPEKLAGIIPNSGFVQPETAAKLRAGAFRGKPAFVAHGETDMVIQISRGREVRQMLEEGGVDLTYQEYPIAHSTSPQSRQDLGNWLNGRLHF